MIDVIVIGAGPAGSEIAFQLSKLGREVYVFERSRLDREKPCGGGIQAVELRDFGDVPDDVLERRISGARVISPRGEVLELTSANGIAAATVKRAVYDRYLQERAAQAGAKVFGHCKVVSVVRGNDHALVTVVQDGNRKEFQAKLVICAAGVNLQLLKRIGFGEIRLPTMFLAVEKWVALEEDAITGRFGNAIELYGGSSVITEGYGWIFPKRDVLSVGVGCTLTAMHQNDLRLKSRLRSFMFDHPIVKEKLSGGQIVHSSGGLIPVEPLDHLYAGRVVLVGDSGGFGSRLHGGGIYQARKSAKICSLYVDRFLDNFDQQHLRDYEVNVKREFWEYEGKWDGKLANFIWKDESLDLSISLANKSDPKLKEAYSILLGSTESHQRAHEIFEAALLDLFSEYLREKAEPYREMLESKLRSIDYEDPLLAPCVKHLLFSDAKRFRATLVFLAFELFSQESLTRVLPLAAAYELAHTASLIHDDMCDDATRRRGEATVHLKYGKAAAITAGDFLSFQAFRMLYDGAWECEMFQAISHKLVSSALEVCKGQGLDIYYTRKMDLWTVERYLSMAELKTGALIEAPLVSGAMVAGADTSHLNALGRIGKDLGLAFQIIDDSKDLLGSEANSQKSIFTDLRQGKCTIITALLNKSCRTADREAIDRILGQSNLTESDALSVIKLCRRYRVLGQSQQICGGFSDSIDKNLATLPPSAARDVLHGVNDRIRDWCSLGDDNLD